LQIEEVYKIYYNKVFRQLVLMIGDEKAAEDLSQEIFMKMYVNPPQHYNISSWLYKVAKNTALNYIKSQRNRDKRERFFFETVQNNENFNEDFIAVKNALEKLDEEDRTILILKYSGYSYEEIAKIMNIKKSSVGTMIARAQRKFKRNFEEG